MAQVNPAASAAWTRRRRSEGVNCSCEAWKPMRAIQLYSSQDKAEQQGTARSSTSALGAWVAGTRPERMGARHLDCGQPTSLTSVSEAQAQGCVIGEQYLVLTENALHSGCGSA